ncbi:hypothetical protein CSOJ01_05959 [Colletotrichum sojae]|uniref:Uncharacterized protein n=1 Tax=Colletotrichum sojae TaxID=2175907 RepID=A0A8H6JEF6_9PEZI|nr:hypothetical protein CSOJ01_05959 [Colletotrichum sojae]
MCNLQGLAELPDEVKSIIWSFSGDHCLLRFSAVLAAVDFLSLTDFDQPISAPLGTVKFWRRGIRPQLGTAPPNSPIELTIDSNGIECIKRLAASEEGSPRSRSQFTVHSTARADQNLTVNFHVSETRFLLASQFSLKS